MPANNAPIHPRAPRAPSVQIPVSATALARTDGVGTVGTDLFLLDTAAADGTYYRHIAIKATATAAATSTTATVIRLFLSSVSSGATTAANTHLIAEIQIPAVSAANATGTTPDFILPLNMALAAGQTLLVGSSVTPGASVAFKCVAVCGDY